MRHAFEKAQRRDDWVARLEAHIRRRLAQKYPLPERPAAAKLRTKDVAEIAAAILESLPRAIAIKSDWWRACEIIAGALGVAGELGTEARLRVGNLAYNFGTDALPDIFQVDYDANHAPRITPGAEDKILAARPVTGRTDPATESPPPWDRPKGFVRSPHREVQDAVRRAFKNRSIEPHARAVTALQSVPLLINPAVLDCLRHFDVHGATGDDRIEHIPQPAPKRHALPWRDRQLHGEWQALRVRFDSNMETATRLLGQPFYVRYCCDSRGRLTAITDINFAREDTIRGLLMFARAKPIGEDGIRRLKIQVATTGGFDGVHRADEDARAAWTDANMGWVRLLAHLPKWRVSQRRLREAREPIQHLAACVELAAALEQGPRFETRLPCTVDATASGYQILALMRGITDEAKLVNLVPTNGPPQDSYGLVADETYNEICEDYFSPTEREIIEEGGSEEATERGLFAEWALKNLTIDRDLVKANVMTKVYGADEHGAMTRQNFEQKQIKALMGAEPRIEQWRHSDRYIGRKYGQRARHLARAVGAATKKLMPKAHETMEWLQEYALALAKRGQFVRLQTPSGFPFVNVYRNQHIKRARFLIGDKPRQKKIIVGWKGPRLKGKRNVQSAVVANTVHSLDAALLMLTVNALALEGITDVVSVHDCFGAHAPDVERMRQIILGQLKLMFEGRDILRDIWTKSRAYGPPPPRETFYWNGLLNARHAFS